MSRSSKGMHREASSSAEDSGCTKALRKFDVELTTSNTFKLTEVIFFADHPEEGENEAETAEIVAAFAHQHYSMHSLICVL